MGRVEVDAMRDEPEAEEMGGGANCCRDMTALYSIEHDECE